MDMDYENADEFDRTFNDMQEWFTPEQADDQMAFIDYEGDGKWILGIMNPQTRTVLDVLDEDECIHTLARRAVDAWGADPTELWLSPCAAILALLGVGMEV
jgi:hypothetical protein